MNNINIDIKMTDSMPVLFSEYDGCTVGSMWDNCAQELVFSRPEELEEYNLLLLFKSGNMDWAEVNIGKENSYVITNALTQMSWLTIQAAFLEGDSFRYGSNKLVFYFRQAPQNGITPESLKTDYTLLREAAVTDASSEENGKYLFYNIDGQMVFELPASTGTGTGISAASASSETLESDKNATAQVSLKEDMLEFSFGIPKGADGEKGATPQRGIDYWTQEDEEKLSSAQETATEAKETAQAAQTAADSVSSTAQSAQTTAAEAKETALAAQTAADSVSSTAQSAQKTAAEAKETALAAQTAADSVSSTAQSAQTTAAEAKETAEFSQALIASVSETAQTAKITAEEAKSMSQAAQTEVSTVLGKAEIAQSSAESANEKAESAQTAASSLQNSLELHAENSSMHVTAAEKEAWNSAGAEFGTWTPSPLSQYSISVQWGRYCKIGKMIIASFGLEYIADKSNVGSTGYVGFSGLPFEAAVKSACGGMIYTAAYSSATYTDLFYQVEAGSSTVFVKAISTNGSAVDLEYSESYNRTNRYYGTLVYYTE